MSRLARRLLMARKSQQCATTLERKQHWGQKLRELSRYLLDTDL